LSQDGIWRAMPDSSEIVCILNGLYDQPLEDLEGKTPLQKAAHPALDELARMGDCRLALPPEHGGFEISLLSMLGLDGAGTARGPLEAFAIGRRLAEDQVAYCVRFVHASGGVIVDLSDGLVKDQEASALCRALTDEQTQFYPLAGPNAVMITRDEALVTSARPHGPMAPADLAGRSWQDLLPAQGLAAGWQSILDGHEINVLKLELEEPPANALLLSDGGREPPMSSLARPDALFYSGDFVSRGIARRVGVPLWQPPGGTDRLQQVQELVRGLPTLLENEGLLIIELDLLWESTYAGNLLEKVTRIEWLDKHLIAPLRQYCDAYGSRLHVLSLRDSDIARGAVLSGPVPVVSYPGSHPLPAFDETMFSAVRETFPISELLA
jgi:2,3-bisphosphoglycerate-independent phosphoglycerate mutase